MNKKDKCPTCWGLILLMINGPMVWADRVGGRIFHNKYTPTPSRLRQAPKSFQELSTQRRWRMPEILQTWAPPTLFDLWRPPQETDERLNEEEEPKKNKTPPGPGTGFGGQTPPDAPAIAAVGPIQAAQNVGELVPTGPPPKLLPYFERACLLFDQVYSPEQVTGHVNALVEEFEACGVALLPDVFRVDFGGPGNPTGKETFEKGQKPSLRLSDDPEQLKKGGLTSCNVMNHYGKDSGRYGFFQVAPNSKNVSSEHCKTYQDQPVSVVNSSPAFKVRTYDRDTTGCAEVDIRGRHTDDPNNPFNPKDKSGHNANTTASNGYAFSTVVMGADDQTRAHEAGHHHTMKNFVKNKEPPDNPTGLKLAAIGNVAPDGQNYSGKGFNSLGCKFLRNGANKDSKGGRFAVKKPLWGHPNWVCKNYGSENYLETRCAPPTLSKGSSVPPRAPSRELKDPEQKVSPPAPVETPTTIASAHGFIPTNESNLQKMNFNAVVRPNRSLASTRSPSRRGTALKEAILDPSVQIPQQRSNPQFGDRLRLQKQSPGAANPNNNENTSEETESSDSSALADSSSDNFFQAGFVGNSFSDRLKVIKNRRKWVPPRDIQLCDTDGCRKTTNYGDTG